MDNSSGQYKDEGKTLMQNICFTLQEEWCGVWWGWGVFNYKGKSSPLRGGLNTHLIENWLKEGNNIFYSFVIAELPLNLQTRTTRTVKTFYYDHLHISQTNQGLNQIQSDD